MNNNCQQTSTNFVAPAANLISPVVVLYVRKFVYSTPVQKSGAPLSYFYENFR